MVPDRVCVVILGARSGTSATAGTLGLLGCKLPSVLMEGNAANEKGYFEPSEIVDLNDEILNLLHSSWDDWRSLPNGWFSSMECRDYTERCKSVILRNYGQASMFVLKDPRITRMVPLWRNVLEEMGVVVKFILVNRDPFLVSTSLAVRDGSSLKQGLLYWLKNNIESERETRGSERVFISYDQLILDWREVVMRIEAGLNISFDYKNKEKIDEFIEDRLCHHRSRDPISSGADEVDTLAVDVNRALRDLIDDGSDQDAIHRLDKHRLLFEEIVHSELRKRDTEASSALP